MFLKNTPGRTAIHNEDFCSVAIVSFNRHQRLLKLIDSIHKYADMPFELVISDDGGFLYDDFNFIRDIRDRVSHLAVNLGVNKGLHVNANTAVSLTRSKYVMLLYDDTEVLRPFMRKAVNILSHAPYVGVIYLAQPFTPPPKSRLPPGFLHCKTPQNQHYCLFCHVGGNQASAFRKNYWLEVGGYSEYATYGDQPFSNKGWQRGYFCSVMADPAEVDYPSYEEHQLLGHSNPGGRYCNYPKIFGIAEDQLRKWGDERQVVIGKRELTARQEEPFSEFSWGDWHKDYMCLVNEGPPSTSLNLDLLEKHHSRFIEQIKRDVVMPTK
jgi:glycosyltransferase involved in cell wall biosynthesis